MDEIIPISFLQRIYSPCIHRRVCDSQKRLVMNGPAQGELGAFPQHSRSPQPPLLPCAEGFFPWCEARRAEGGISETASDGEAASQALLQEPQHPPRSPGSSQPVKNGESARKMLNTSIADYLLNGTRI